MKKAILLFALISNFCFAQTEILNPLDLKSGVYITINDLIKNKPTPLKKVKLRLQSIMYGNFNQEELYTYYLGISQEEKKALGNIYAFSDGKDLYVSHSESRKPANKGYFRKVEFIGDFLFFESVKDTNELYVKIKSNNIIDLKNRKIFINVNNRVFKKIIFDDKVLLEKFKKEKKKHLKYKEYLIKFIKKEK